MLKPIAIAALCVMATGYAMPQAAMADDDGGACGGQLIDYVPVSRGGTRIGQLQMYYNSANGKNCAIMYHGGPTWGEPLKTGVYLWQGPRNTGGTRRGAEYRVLRYQAGPVRYNGRGICMWSFGTIEVGRTTYTARSSVHCD